MGTTLHKDLTGADLHIPKAHTHVKAEITDFPVLIPGTGNGDVVGPVSATPGDLATFADTTGKNIQDGGAIPTLSGLGGVATGDSRLSDARTPTAHTHVKANITDFPTISAAGQALIDDADATAQRVTLGGVAVGPASAILNHLVTFADATGKVLQDSGFAVAPINHIGVPGQLGFGVGICPGALPAGMMELNGTRDPTSDNYGNYQYSDGSVMVWIPAFFYKFGTGSNGNAVNVVTIKPLSAYADVATANADGYALHRMFYDGVVQPGVFVDKYICSNNGGIASSIKNGIVLTSAQRGSLSTAMYSALTGAPANNLGGSQAAAKTRGASFFANSRFIQAGLALLALAHGQAATSVLNCAWFMTNSMFPKGGNNNALGDVQDATITYVSDGNGTYNVGKTGSANYLAKTTHNGQLSGVCDLNGLIWEVGFGLGSNGTDYFVLKTAKAMKALTGSNTLSTDLFGATGLAANFDDIGATWGAVLASSTVKYYGSATQVLSAALSGNDWAAAGLGLPLVGGVGGSNLFGNDYLADYRPNELCPISGGSWGDASNAGMWALHLSYARAYSNYDVGFRSALYLL